MSEITDKLGYVSPLGEKSLFNAQNSESISSDSNAETNIDVIEINSSLYDAIFEFSQEELFPAGRLRKLYPGAYGHGDIEDIALGETKSKSGMVLFDKEEINKIYFGNWLRDFSQMIVKATVKSYFKEYKKIKKILPLIPRSIKKDIEERHAKLDHDTLVKLLKIIAVKEFIYNVKIEAAKEDKNIDKPHDDYKIYKEEFIDSFIDVTRDSLGIYRPEEHIDNPKKLEDESKIGVYFIYEYMAKNDKKPRKKIIHLYNGETLPIPPEITGESLKITNNSNSKFPPDNFKNFIVNDIPYTEEEKNIALKLTKLSLAEEKKINPNYNGVEFLKGNSLDYQDYRPSAVSYMLEQFRLAAYYGKNKKGFMHFGAGLHVLEDFYAHTNFCELSLIKYGKVKTHPFVVILDEVLLSELETRKVKASDFPLVSGLFALDDTIVSIVPKIVDVLFSTQKEEFVKRKKGERTFSEAFIQTYLEDREKTEQEILDNPELTQQEKDKKIDEISLQEPFTEIKVRPSIALDNFKNIYLKFVDEWADTTTLKEKDNLAKIIAKGALITIERNLHNTIQFFAYYLKLVLNNLFNTIDDGIIANQDKNYGEQGNDPTHSQVSKDHPEHHFNTLAGELAVAAVYEVGTIMNGIWDKNPKYSIDNLERIVTEKYFQHPADTDWMKKLVEKWIVKHPEEVERAEYKNSLEYTIAKGEDAVGRFKHEHSKFSEFIQDKIKEIDELN